MADDLPKVSLLVMEYKPPWNQITPKLFRVLQCDHYSPCWKFDLPADDTSQKVVPANSCVCCSQQTNAPKHDQWRAKQFKHRKFATFWHFAGSCHCVIAVIKHILTSTPKRKKSLLKIFWTIYKDQVFILKPLHWILTNVPFQGPCIK